jgi:peptidoglycan/LPS O-acetylase OafA/YrhL
VRNRYIDVLRATAIIRVIVYHTLGFWWLTVVFPAMGLMFALGGSLMAASIDRSGAAAVGRRLRRILLPVWVLASIAVVSMSFVGGTQPTWRWILWIVPFGDAPTTVWGGTWLAMFWYVRSYLWFVVLSPALLWVYRKWPIPALLVPFAVLVTMVLTGSPFATGGTIRDFFYYAPAWMLGFAYHDGQLRRLSRKVLWPIVAVLAGFGLTWLFTHPGPRIYDLNDNPLADATWSTAFLLVLLAYAPRIFSLGRADATVEAMNRRALTIYLWHQAAIALVDFGAALLGISLLGRWGGFIELSSVLIVLGLLVLTFGWVEDFAARRRPALVPVPVERPAVEREPQPATA